MALSTEKGFLIADGSRMAVGFAQKRGPRKIVGSGFSLITTPAEISISHWHQDIETMGASLREWHLASSQK
jgi:hypothetical protein